MTAATVVLHELRPGRGTPLVLLHAFPLDARMWADVAALLPGAAPVLAIDLPGLGAAAGARSVAVRSSPSTVATEPSGCCSA